MRTRRKQTKTLALALAAAGMLAASSGSVLAQEIDIEVPTVIIEQGGDEGGDDTTELDLANIVQSAAKGVTTVQEAPAIVTVITGDEIRERGYESLQQIVDGVPGWLRLGAVYSFFPFPTARGTAQAMMYMHNGISLFDPALNVATVGRQMPLELIKRVEMVTGPGGVLWGANSYLGILNIITKDADDVDGVEANVLYGSGNGDRSVFRGYVMAGIQKPVGGDSKLLLHASFENYKGPALQLAQHQFATPLPQPNSSIMFGPFTTANPERSFAFNFNTKFSIGKLSVYASLPYLQRHAPLGISGFVAKKDRVEDTLRDPNTGELLCPFEEPYFDPSDQCLDKGRRARDNEVNFMDRYVVAEYRTRLADGRAGFTAKAYAVQFYREFAPLGILPEVEGLLEGGLGFNAKPISYRSGGMIDADLELGSDVRLLYGAEGFREWVPTDANSRSRQGAGIQATAEGPYQLERLPLPCPKRPAKDESGAYTGGTEFVEDCPLTFAFATSRSVIGAYVNPQWKASKNLTIDGGVRLQIAPEGLGDIGYPLQSIFSASAVYGFSKDWHLKVNYSEGFRPPVFNNTSSNGQSIQIGGFKDLEVENSKAFQTEVNARIFKGERRVRELSFRADYSYTKLDNLIQVFQGGYRNSGSRGIHSAEFLGKLYLKGGHRVELGYTWLRMLTADQGNLKQFPEHWFNLTGIFALTGKLQAATNLRVVGASEDANRLVEHRNFAYSEETGRSMNILTNQEQLLITQPHGVSMDLLPPGAEFTLGVNYLANDRLRFSMFAYNAFNARYYQPDVLAGYEPRLEFLPNPVEDFRFKLNATYTY